MKYLLVMLTGLSFVSCRTKLDSSVWRVGNVNVCCSGPWFYHGYLELTCGELGDAYVFNTAVNTKVPCDGPVE